MNNKYIIFIYDNCLNGMKDHYILNGAKFHKHDVILKYNLMLLQDVPMATPNKSVWNMSSKIYVESYYIDEKIRKKLDEYYKVPEYFQRNNVKSKSGDIGVLYYVDEKKTTFRGKGQIIGKKWSEFFKSKEKYDIKKEKRKAREE